MDQDGDDEEEGEGGQGGHEDEQEEEDRQTPLPPLRRNKGKEKAVLPNVPEEEEDVEDEIVQGMHEVEQQQYDDDDGGGEEEDYPEPESRRNKKAKFAKEEARKPRGKSKKENRGKSSYIQLTAIITNRMQKSAKAFGKAYASIISLLNGGEAKNLFMGGLVVIHLAAGSC
jgi:hypothetical protein